MIVASNFEGAQGAIVNNSIINAANVIHNNYYTTVQALAQDKTSAAPIAPIKPNSSALFTGRKDVLERLKNHFVTQSVGDGTTVRRYFLLYGMGGIGKTQICLKFSEEMEDSFSQVFWVDASSEESILLSLKGIAKAAGIDDSSDSATLLYIGSLKTNWLLIFNNADLGPEIVEKSIPPRRRGNILISSRNGYLRSLTTNQNSLELHEMEETEAITFLLKAAFLDNPTTSDLQFARDIVTTLCCVPLAIGQAGSSIASGICNIDGYLKLYSLKSKYLLSDPHFRGASKYGKTVYGTWEISFEEIQKRASDGSQEAQTAIVILQTFAFFHHSNIREEFFKRAALNAIKWNPEDEENIKLPQIMTTLDCTLLTIDPNGEWDSLQFKQGIRMLLSFSLIQLSTSNEVYSVHPLVHMWSRERLSSSEQHIYFKQTVALLSSSMSYPNDVKYSQYLLPHIMPHCEAGAKLNIFQNYYDDVYLKFGGILSKVGFWKYTHDLWSNALDIREKSLGKEHEGTLIVAQALAATYLNLGRFVDAEKLEVQVLDMSKRLLGAEHPLTLTGIQNLARIYDSLGRILKAEKLEVPVWEMSKRLLGEEDPLTLARMQNLARTYCRLGRFTEAEKLEVQVLERSKRLLGEEHPDTLTRMQNLARTYNSLEIFQEAEKLDEQVLEMSKILLGEEHPFTVVRMQNLAKTYYYQERVAEAEKLEIQVLEMSKRLLGDEHLDTLTRMQNLAVTYWSTKRFSEAEKLELQVLELSKRLLGEEHPETISRMQNLARTYESLERFEEAEMLEVQVLEMSTRVLGEKHPFTLMRMNNVAATYHFLGRAADAE